MVNQYAHLWEPALDDEDAIKKKYPKDIVVLDFKASDSLIENIAMNSTLDPHVAAALQDASEDFTGTTDALINFLSYKEVATDLQKFLAEDDVSKKHELDKAITIDDFGKVTLDKGLLLLEDGSGAKDVVTTAVGQFLSNNPRRLTALRALTQAAQVGQANEDGSGMWQGNFATQLMSSYMRKTTITIHGTTNIGQHHKVIVKGVMPNLEGMYRIYAVRESITPQGFQTILEGALVGKGYQKNARVLGVPVESEQEPAFQENPPADSVDQASQDE